jgi:hypothetical protein
VLRPYEETQEPTLKNRGWGTRRRERQCRDAENYEERGEEPEDGHREHRDKNTDDAEQRAVERVLGEGEGEDVVALLGAEFAVTACGDDEVLLAV